MKKFEAPKNQSKKHLKKRLEHIRDFDIKPDEEPVIKGKGIEKAIEKQKDVIPSKLGTDNNVQSIMNRINFSKSTVEGRQYDRIERFIKSHLDKDEEPLTNTPEEKIAKVAIDTIGKDELVPEEVVVPEAAVPPVEPVLDLGIKPEQVQQAEGGIQPNGRKSTFTREEDLQAQENTYNPLNIF